MSNNPKIMRTLTFILLFGLFGGLCFSQTGKELTEKRNIFNKKGNYYLERKEYQKAIAYYNLAFQNDQTDYFSVLQKAEAYTKLGWYPQAELCYRSVFNTDYRVPNTFKLKYALVLLENGKKDAFRDWLTKYSDVVNEEVQSENYLISQEKRIQLYKDTAIVLEGDTLRFKVKYEGYQYRRRTSSDEKEIFVVLANGDEHSIRASESDDFIFSFQPMEDYKMIMQQENIKAEDIVGNKSLSADKKAQAFLQPPPVKRDELILQKGMKYQFSSGKYEISPQYINSMKQLAQKYQGGGDEAVDLTALVKELQLDDGELYSIRFARIEDPTKPYKKLEISTVTMNDKTVNIFGQSFLVMLPERAQENFAIQTDMEELEKNFNPRKHSLVVDDEPLFKFIEKPVAEGMISLTVNTKDVSEVPPGNQITANEISIIPGTVYLLTLSKPDPRRGREIEVIVPLTDGVRYNMTSDQSQSEYKEALAEFLTGREDVKLAEEEVIDISILSKELEVKPDEELSFSLQPALRPGSQSDAKAIKPSTLTIDEEVYEISTDEKYVINVPFNAGNKVNIQTDLEYVQENFEPEDYTLRLDTVSFTAEITIDTTGFGAMRSTGWLSMNVNTDSRVEVEEQDQFVATEVSIIPGNEYILTVSKIDAETGKKEEVFIPLLRDVKYDFTSKPQSPEHYEESLQDFLAGREKLETMEGTLIDITILSKELQIAEDDEVSFSLLPVRKLKKDAPQGEIRTSSLLLDNKVVEFTYIHKYTINIPLSEEGKVNMQTNLQHLEENFNPAYFTVNVDTLSFFTEIQIDTIGLGERVIPEVDEIKDPVFDKVVIYFDVNEHELKPDARKNIQENVIIELKKDSRLYVTIEGYTDALGDADYNLELSRKRARSVQYYLMKNGIGQKRIRTFSFGETQALQEGLNWEDLSEEELRKHRKVEIVIYLPK